MGCHFFKRKAYPSRTAFLAISKKLMKKNILEGKNSKTLQFRLRRALYLWLRNCSGYSNKVVIGVIASLEVITPLRYVRS